MFLGILHVMRLALNAVHQHDAWQVFFITRFDMRLATRLTCSRSAVVVEHTVRKVGHGMLIGHLWQEHELNREPAVGFCYCDYCWLVYDSKALFDQGTLIPVAPMRLRDRGVDGRECMLACIQLRRAENNV